jgi:hypothetical protein
MTVLTSCRRRHLIAPTNIHHQNALSRTRMPGLLEEVQELSLDELQDHSIAKPLGG